MRRVEGRVRACVTHTSKAGRRQHSRLRTRPRQNAYALVLLHRHDFVVALVPVRLPSRGANARRRKEHQQREARPRHRGARPTTMNSRAAGRATTTSYESIDRPHWSLTSTPAPCWRGHTIERARACCVGPPAGEPSMRGGSRSLPVRWTSYACPLQPMTAGNHIPVLPHASSATRLTEPCR